MRLFLECTHDDVTLVFDAGIFSSYFLGVVIQAVREEFGEVEVHELGEREEWVFSDLEPNNSLQDVSEFIDASLKASGYPEHD